MELLKELEDRRPEVDAVIPGAVSRHLPGHRVRQGSAHGGQGERQEAGVDFLVHVQPVAGAESLHAEPSLEGFLGFFHAPALGIERLEKMDRVLLGIEQVGDQDFHLPVIQCHPNQA